MRHVRPALSATMPSTARFETGPPGAVSRGSDRSLLPILRAMTADESQRTRRGRRRIGPYLGESRRGAKDASFARRRSDR